ncbi:gamma-glutamyltransferase 1 [Patellaria atrata CBS 101060]|uniref:Glutathione hydrolase n=1 Tax=Patellaria atrata CBS 101060 TaxID=1346257 RepID=A0A9P4VR96_9PEZI|nr:gamma-glutamyltransferase 1 [Patellaria atrata CBS 101060]
MPPLNSTLTALLAFAGQLAFAIPTAHRIPKLGAVASETSECSRVGIDLLKAGGNAADAMVGTVFCVGVIGMYHSGVGGGGFMLVRGSNGSYEYIDFREAAPAAAFEDMYTNATEKSLLGGLASGVPGELRGLEYLHKTYGVLPWAKVMAPAIKYARCGFKVSADLVRNMKSVSADSNFLTEDPTWAIDFAPNGRLLQLNETITRKRYADTLESIAQQGADAFYTGAIANATIQALRKQNGTMTLEDLKNYTVAIRKPAEIDYRGYKVRSVSAPASGAVALSILKTLEGYEGVGDPAQFNLTTHRLDEAMRFAYGARANLGDPSFLPNLTTYQTAMLSSLHAAEVRSLISDDYSHPNVSYYSPEGLESLDTPGTSHISVADSTGMAVSLTTTVNLLFGSKLMVPETGVIMNNEMNDFSIPGSSNAFGYVPSPANYVRPGKRPLSSISASIVETPDGEFYFAIGAAGGSRIITATTQNIVNVLDRGFDTHDALAQPRLHDQLTPNLASLEYSFDNGTAEFLRERGHNVTYVAEGMSAAQGVRRLGNGTFEAAGEPRQGNSGGFAV